MTMLAEWFYVKPVLWLIAVMMVILSWFTTSIALLGMNPRQSFQANSSANSAHCLAFLRAPFSGILLPSANLLWMPLLIPVCSLSFFPRSLWCTIISLVSFISQPFGAWSISVLAAAILAVNIQSVFTSVIFVKFIPVFPFLAFGALLLFHFSSLLKENAPAELSVSVTKRLAEALSNWYNLLTTTDRLVTPLLYLKTDFCQ